MDFYYLPPSPPCRAVEMTAMAVGVKLNKKVLDANTSEDLKAEFLKINPQHTVPTLVDGELTLWESRAIMTYLCEKYDTSKSWYPDCPKSHAIINQRLYFDMQVLAQSFTDYYVPIFKKKAPANPEMFKKCETAFEFLNTFLAAKKYAAGDTPTVADISLLANMTSFDVCKFDYSKYANVVRWYEDCKKNIPGYAENLEVCLNYLKKV